MPFEINLINWGLNEKCADKSKAAFPFTNSIFHKRKPIWWIYVDSILSNISTMFNTFHVVIRQMLCIIYWLALGVVVTDLVQEQFLDGIEVLGSVEEDSRDADVPAQGQANSRPHHGGQMEQSVKCHLKEKRHVSLLWGEQSPWLCLCATLARNAWPWRKRLTK